MSRYTGRAYISIPGFGRVPSEKGSTLHIGGVTKEPVVTDSGIAGFRDGDPVPAKVECTINHHSGISLEELRDFQGNIDFETDSGVSFKVVGCECEEPPTLSGGQIPIVYVGKYSEEQK